MWNSTTNSFVLIDNNDKVIYPSNLTISHKANLYKVINNEEDVKNFEGYSMYVSDTFNKDTINIKKMSNIEVAKKNLKINIISHKRVICNIIHHNTHQISVK